MSPGTTSRTCSKVSRGGGEGAAVGGGEPPPRGACEGRGGSGEGV